MIHIPQILTDETEVSLRGCGLLDAYGLGFIENVEDIAKIKDSKKEIIYPNKTSAEYYKILFSESKRMNTHLLGYWR